MNSTAGTPRWVKIFGMVALVLFVVFAVLHLTGHGLHDHTPPLSPGVVQP